jgi:hypothetical protein
LRAIVAAAIVAAIAGGSAWLVNRVMIGQLLEIVVNLVVFLGGPVVAGFVAGVVGRRAQGVIGAAAGYLIAVTGLPVVFGDRPGLPNSFAVVAAITGGLVVAAYFFALALHRPVLTT